MIRMIVGILCGIVMGAGVGYLSGGIVVEVIRTKLSTSTYEKMIPIFGTIVIFATLMGALIGLIWIWTRLNA